MTLIPIVVVLTAAFISQATISAPAGYRRPTASDYTEGWASFRGAVPEPFVARADFNGDGHQDEAWLLVREPGGFGLFVFLGSPTASARIVQLTEAKSLRAQSHGVEVALPGPHMTACGKGHWVCNTNEPEVLTLETPGILLQQFESSSSIFWWSRKSNRFERTWISD
jgi:hypothetical protein